MHDWLRRVQGLVLDPILVSRHPASTQSCSSPMPTTLTPAPSETVVPKKDVSGSLRRFRPRLALGYGGELCDAIEAADDRLAQFEALGLSLPDLFPTLQWATALRVLRDLHTQGWTFHTDDEGLLLKSPGTETGADPEIEKEAVRRSFAFARDAQ